MCGIFGVLLGPDATVPRDTFGSVLDCLFKLSESRGKEASGLAVRHKEGIQVLKQPVPASRLIKSGEYRALFNGSSKIYATPNGFTGPLAAIGHSRLVTNGHHQDNDNNQPVTYANTTGVHNGIVVNGDEIWQRFPALQRKSEVDSESIVALVSLFRQEHGSLSEAVQKAFERIEGAASVALLFEDTQHVALATNTGSLFLCQGEKTGIGLFGSEAYILNQLMEYRPLRELLGSFAIVQIKPGHGQIVDLNSFGLEPFRFEMNTHRALGKPNRILRRVVDFRSAEPVEVNPKGLRRCTRCILPESMPFIEFDEKGVCNYCRNYEKLEVKGREGLEEALSQYRRRDGEADCIVAFSGGRDSCYGLHMLKTEFGMNPIALTYDWGMVTDLARRNQARVCGKLGIEHIIVSANIEKKRANIRKNVKAWLNRPDLGIIPLFMAGDKQFFYFADKVSKQTGVKLIVFCVNPQEYTYFKSGFSGVSDLKFYNTTVGKKIKLISYYLRQFITNPGYINLSLFDTIWAFASSYLMPLDFLSPFDYVPWDEDEINKTLVELYDWEMAPDTKSLWRIGDGTAPFYNYIYHKVAGFTENDTFRSNQVREGIITREQAMGLTMEDNKPRWESISEYLDLIELPFKETIETIDAIPPLYE